MTMLDLTKIKKNKTESVTEEKSRLHDRNKHQGRYDLASLVETLPELKQYVGHNVHEKQTIDFFNPDAVIALNKALLMHHYGVSGWEIPKDYLCPPIPGRVDYLHHMADLLAKNTEGEIPKGDKIKCLDIGTGASLIYPILGIKEYGWNFVAGDIDQVALDSAKAIIDANDDLKQSVELRLQKNPKDIFYKMIQEGEQYDMVVCNPPFHGSADEAREGAYRKLKNLKGKKEINPTLNFGGQSNELWCEGGEVRFVSEMIRESKKFASSCMWYSSLVSKSSHLKPIIKALTAAKVAELRNIPMGTGNKTSRVVAWTFMTQEKQEEWIKNRWS